MRRCKPIWSNYYNPLWWCHDLLQPGFVFALFWYVYSAFLSRVVFSHFLSSTSVSCLALGQIILSLPPACFFLFLWCFILDSLLHFTVFLYFVYHFSENCFIFTCLPAHFLHLGPTLHRNMTPSSPIYWLAFLQSWSIKHTPTVFTLLFFYHTGVCFVHVVQ